VLLLLLQVFFKLNEDPAVLLHIYESGCYALFTSSTSPTDSVHVVNEVAWCLVVDYMGNVLYVYTPSSDICANQDISYSLL
jgi:hypothetical protein